MSDTEVPRLPPKDGWARQVRFIEVTESTYIPHEIRQSTGEIVLFNGAGEELVRYNVPPMALLDFAHKLTAEALRRIRNG